MSPAPRSPERFRERFPIFERKVYLNSCSQGALSTDVEDGYRHYLDSWKHEGSPWEEWVAVLEKARARFASFCGAGEDEVAVSFSASTAVAGLLSSLSYQGDRRRILIEDFEFPTMAHNFLAQERRGAEIVRVRATDGRLDLRAYEDVLDERVLLVPASHVSFKNGYRQDVESIVASARKHGALSLVDDYQSSGTRPLDVKKLGCDFLVTGALKYLLGSPGLAFLYLRRDRIEGLEPFVTGWFGQARPFDFDIERGVYHESARRFETGTPPIPSLYAFLSGLSVLDEVGADLVSAHVERLATMLIEEAKSRGYRLLTPEEPESRGPLVVLGCSDASRMVQALARENIVVSARGAGLRVSFHYYNIPEDVEALLRVLERNEELVAGVESRR